MWSDLGSGWFGDFRVAVVSRQSVENINRSN